MNKYTLVSVIEITSFVYVIAVILIAATYQNYWLLLLILLAGTSSETRDAILRSDYKKERRKK